MPIILFQVISPSHNKTGSSKSKAPANSLLDGEYNENEAAQSFQQALAEWRKENTDPSPIKPTVLTSSKESKQPSARPTQRPSNTVVSPVSTPSKLYFRYFYLNSECIFIHF